MTPPARVAVLGAGAWGTTLASLVSGAAETRLWAREPEVVAAIRDDHENALFLPGFELPPGVRATGDLDEALCDADVVITSVPAQHLRSVMVEAEQRLPAAARVLSATKGIEQGTCRRMTEVLAETLPQLEPDRIGVIAGPNLAREVMAGQPAASCIAFPRAITAEALRELFPSERFRVYTSTDVVGCEIGGSVKNVVAIAAGVADGLGFGMNAKAALITRGLAELTRLGIALGGNALTFLGLAGNGDLIVTCSSPLSRNHRLGVELASGRPVAEILSDSSSVAEGAQTAPVVVELAQRVGVSMPISSAVAALLQGAISADDVVAGLMSRQPTHELHGLVDD